MKKEITIDTDAEILKDILWEIKGMNFVVDDNRYHNLFDEKHEQALISAIYTLQQDKDNVCKKIGILDNLNIVTDTVKANGFNIKPKETKYTVTAILTNGEVMYSLRGVETGEVFFVRENEEYLFVEEELYKIQENSNG